jgi:hypothetical protein
MRRPWLSVATFVFAACVSVASFAPAAYATTYLLRIDDLSDQIGVALTADGSPSPFPSPPSFGTENVTVTLTFTVLTLSANTNNAYNIYEPDGVTLSDTFHSTGTQGGSSVTSTFLSDTESSLGSPLTPLINGTSLIETGDWQTVLTVSLLDSSGAATSSLTVQFRSDVETPLPAALPLFATGLGTLGLLGWRRKRKGQT